VVLVAKDRTLREKFPNVPVSLSDAPDRQTRIGGLAAGLGGSKEKAARVSGLRLGLGKETARRQTASDDRKAS